MRKKKQHVLAQIPHSSVIERQPHIEHRRILFLSIDRGVIIQCRGLFRQKTCLKDQEGAFSTCQIYEDIQKYEIQRQREGGGESKIGLSCLTLQDQAGICEENAGPKGIEDIMTRAAFRINIDRLCRSSFLYKNTVKKIEFWESFLPLQADPDSLSPDPDPAFQAEYQSGSGSGSRVFDDQKLKIIYK